MTERRDAGWVSPDYTVSRGVTLDREKMAANRCVAFAPESLEVESYRVLRTRILHRAKRKGGNTVMITSALPGEGKTLTSINLALTFAKTFNQTVLLVDADLRMQNIHEIMGYESTKGLVEYLLDGCPVSELMVWPGVEKLTVISGGRTIGESSELLGSPGMATLVEEMKTRMCRSAGSNVLDGVTGLHRGNEVQLRDARDVARREDLQVLDTMSAVARTPGANRQSAPASA